MSLGSYSFTAGNTDAVSLAENAGAAVNADAVKLVRDNSADVDNEKKHYTYEYDPADNLTSVTDGSSGALIDAYGVDYDALNRVSKVTESRDGAAQHTTQYTYDPNGNVLTHKHDDQVDTYEYDATDLLSKVTNATSASDPKPKVSTYTYDPLGQMRTETKPNHDTVEYQYFLDGPLQHQVEKKQDGTLVSEHTYEYDANGNRTKDTSKEQNADDHSKYLDRTATYTYDPRDQVESVRTVDSDSGDQVGSEDYVYDPNANVTSQTINGVTTTSTYDRNRLLVATRGGVASNYNYDPLGRLDTVTVAGQVAQSYTYDGFNRVTRERSLTDTTDKTYDPLDRTETETDHAGTGQAKTTTFTYLGLTDQELGEQTPGEASKTFQYSPYGDRLAQTTTGTDGSTDDAYYGYNGHDDVENVTDSSGDAKSTYGYTAYGQQDSSATTGADKSDPQDPTQEPYNSYRYNAKRWDAGSGSYDMGFRDYDPGLNRFLTRDAYDGALSDMNLATDPWTNNRYAFAGGNPVTGIELDGHLTGHDAAVLATASEIEAWAKATNTPGTVTVDVGPGGRTANTIPGAHRSGNGNDGVADIIFWGQDVVYIWEVKPGNEGGREAGPPQLKRYIEKLQEDLKAKGDNRTVMAGPDMPRVGNVPSDQGPIDVWSEGGGMRYYGSSNSKKKPPATKPVPVPAPQPQKQPAKKPVQQPSNDGWQIPGWVAPVAGGVLILGGIALAVGTILEDVGTGGLGILDDVPSFAAVGAMFSEAWSLF